MKLLLAYDGFDHSRAALEAVATLARGRAIPWDSRIRAGREGLAA